MNQYSKNKGSNPVAGHRVTRSAGILLVASLLALFMIIAGALPALAADGKIYPGSMGIRYSGTSTPCLQCGAIGNPSTSSWFYLDLPVIHDSIYGNINKSWVRVTDRHYSSNIRCSLCNRYRCGYGWCGCFSPTVFSSGSGRHEQRLITGRLSGNTTSHYYFSCDIPPRYNNNTSYINSYYVEED